MNKVQLKACRDWVKVRAQIAKCGVLVSSHESKESLCFYRGKDYVKVDYNATIETYNYLGMRWDFTVVKDKFSFELDGYNGSKRDVTYQPGEITRMGYKG